MKSLAWRVHESWAIEQRPKWHRALHSDSSLWTKHEPLTVSAGAVSIIGACQDREMELLMLTPDWNRHTCCRNLKLSAAGQAVFSPGKRIFSSDSRFASADPCSDGTFYFDPFESALMWFWTSQNQWQKWLPWGLHASKAINGRWDIGSRPYKFLLYTVRCPGFPSRTILLGSTTV